MLPFHGKINATQKQKEANINIDLFNARQKPRRGFCLVFLPV
jgi:hypothetical protein